MYNIFLILLLQQDITKQKQIDKNFSWIELKHNNNRQKYEIEEIYNNKIYTKELDSGHYLLNLYYLIFWKSYFQKKNTHKPVSAIQYFQRFIITFYYNHLDKPIVIYLTFDFTLLKVRPKVKSKTKALSSKQKYD